MIRNSFTTCNLCLCCHLEKPNCPRESVSHFNITHRPHYPLCSSAYTQLLLISEKFVYNSLERETDSSGDTHTNNKITSNILRALCNSLDVYSLALLLMTQNHVIFKNTTNKIFQTSFKPAAMSFWIITVFSGINTFNSGKRQTSIKPSGKGSLYNREMSQTIIWMVEHDGALRLYRSNKEKQTGPN